MTAEVCKGVIFDLDGVITGTAKVHSKSWEKMFNEFLSMYAEREDKPFLPFDPKDDYLKYVDGKPRYQGVKSFLQSRGIDLPFGSPDDPSDKETVCGLGNRKNVFFREIIQEQGPEVFDTSVKFIKALKEEGIRVGVASSSRNCRLILEQAGLMDMFETRVDGEVSAELKLQGKPDPDIFVTAARNMDLRPAQCVVVEDAISGVQAGKAGNFGLVLGVARDVDGKLLERFGADIVVRDLGEITVSDVREWFRAGLLEEGWNLHYEGFDPGDEKLRETLTTVGNGVVGTRGAFEGESAGFHYYPGTYIAGVFNKQPSEVHGRTIYNNDFVNCPNWLLIEFKIGSGEYVSPMSLELMSYHQNLDMRRALLERTIVCKDNLGRITRIQTGRIASMAEPGLLSLHYDITPINYSAPITVRSSLDGNVINDNVARYRQLASRHLEFVNSGPAEDGESIYLHVRTNNSKYEIVMQARTQVYEERDRLELDKKLVTDMARIGEEMVIPAKENRTYRVEKLVGLATSLHEIMEGVSSLREEASRWMNKAHSFRNALGPHVRAWEALWDKCDVQIRGDRFSQKVSRLHMYHLLVTASPHNRMLDAGMPARGLHGESYRGHIFWDEIYIMPFYDLHFPEIAQALLLYRYRRLGPAMEYARQNGYEGAMFPWQTADDGYEETQELHYNPQSDDWGPDLSRRQRHVSIAVFYNVWRYASSANDTQFLAEYGAEMMLQIARFWGSIAYYDKNTDRYHIEGVMGPDEFHEKLPGSAELGLKDNAYTNIMTVWLLEKALSLLDTGIISPETMSKLEDSGFSQKDIEKWRDMITKMNVIITDEGIISQFDGYMDLDELDWEDYRKRYYSVARMDRILKAEGDSPDHYKVAKQADVLMTYYLLEPDEVSRILNQLGYNTGDSLELLKRNYHYYVARTSHGSTLSKIVHTVIACYVQGCDQAWQWFKEAMESDIYDTQGGTTTEGVHSGVMAGTIEAITRYFAGVDISGETIHIHPSLPDHWTNLAFKLLWKNTWYGFRITQEKVAVRVEGKGHRSIRVRVKDTELTLAPGEEQEVRY